MTKHELDEVLGGFGSKFAVELKKYLDNLSEQTSEEICTDAIETQRDLQLHYQKQGKVEITKSLLANFRTAVNQQYDNVVNNNQS